MVGILSSGVATYLPICTICICRSYKAIGIYIYIPCVLGTYISLWEYTGKLLEWNMLSVKKIQQLYLFTNMLYLISSITKKLAQIIQENF